MVAPAFLKPLSWCSREKRPRGQEWSPETVEPNNRALGGGPNQNKIMRARDEGFKKHHHSTEHTVGPREMAAVMIRLWKVLRNPK